MIKSELIEKLTYRFDRIEHRQMQSVVDAILELMSKSLEKGNRIEIRGFGSFSLRRSNARLGHNPKTLETVKIPAKTKIHFKPGLEMRERVNLAFQKEF